jgi:hypothetical protein
MKQITLVNTDKLIALALQEYFVISEDMTENVFIDWHNPKQNLEQITILESAISNKSNVVLFDRYLSLKDTEISWLLRYKNVHLVEPCLLTRKGFTYMPFWYVPQLTIEDDPEKTIELGGVPELNRTDIVRDHNVPIYDSYLHTNMTILFGSEKEYARGYLPDISDILYNKCIPLLPGKHKYYWSLFPGLVINSKKDLDWCINTLRLNDAIVFGVYDTIVKSFPEMIVSNVANKIKDLY